MNAGNADLRLYVDSAHSADWETYLPSGMFYGVTTNPKLLQAAGVAFKVNEIARLAQESFSLGAQEIHLQVWGKDLASMLARGRELSDIDPRVMVKVPIDRQGILCANTLIAEGTSVTLTALHSAKQAVTAVALGPWYAAPYLGRMNDGGLDGIDQVLTMHEIVSTQNSRLRLLVASIRQVAELVSLASRGLNTFTLVPALIEELLTDQYTLAAVKAFDEAVD